MHGSVWFATVLYSCIPWVGGARGEAGICVSELQKKVINYFVQLLYVYYILILFLCFFPYVPCQLFLIPPPKCAFQIILRIPKFCPGAAVPTPRYVIGSGWYWILHTEFYGPIKCVIAKSYCICKPTASKNVSPFYQLLRIILRMTSSRAFVRRGSCSRDIYTVDRFLSRISNRKPRISPGSCIISKDRRPRGRAPWIHPDWKYLLAVRPMESNF